MASILTMAAGFTLVWVGLRIRFDYDISKATYDELGASWDERGRVRPNE